MDETSEEHIRIANQQRPLPACSSPLPPPVCSSPHTWRPVDPLMSNCDTGQDHPSQDHQPGTALSPFYEELFCTSRTPNSLVPLAGAFITSSSVFQSDVVKQGCLGKLERNHRRYFVLRGGSHTGPSRLEWYKSQEKFTAAEKSAGKAALFGSGKQGLMYLRCCIGVSRVSSSRKGHTVTLYAKDQTVVLVVEDQREQEEWYRAIKKLMEEERRDDEHGEGFDEEDDGYCTLPPAAFFKEVWPVTVKPQGLGTSKSLVGESRLCLTATSLILIRVGACSDLPSVTIPLLSVRRFGHLNGLFFLELGRSAPNGPGEIWMETKDQGNPAVAQHIHEVIRETIKDLRALPDFSWSPTSNNNRLQSFLTSKRCRPKYRDKPVNVRPLGSHLVPPPRTPEAQTKSGLESRKGVKTEPESPPSSTSPLRSHLSPTPETCGYMEMKTEHPLLVNTPNEKDYRRAAMMKEDCRSVTACKTEGWEPGEEEGEGLGYMMMSPQVSSSSFELPQDDYVTMASPQKHDLPANASLQTSFSSFISDGYSPVHSPPNWLTSVQPPGPESEADQSQSSISSSRQPSDEGGHEQKPTEQGQLSAQSRVTSTPVRYQNRTEVIALFPSSGPGYTSQVQVGTKPGTGKSGQAASDRSIRRSWLSLCLPPCFKADE